MGSNKKGETQMKASKMSKTALLLLALALSSCGSTDSSAAAETTAATTTTASSTVLTTTTKTESTEAAEPESKAETTTKTKSATTTTAESKAETRQAQTTSAETQTRATATQAPQTTTTQAATKATEKQTSATEKKPEPPKQDDTGLGEIFSTVNKMFGKSPNDAAAVFEKQYGLKFGYSFVESLGKTYESDDGEQIEFEHGAERIDRFFISKKSETFKVLDTDVRVLVIRSDDERGTYSVRFCSNTDFEEYGAAAQLPSVQESGLKEFRRLVGLVDRYDPKADYSADLDTGYFAWYGSPAGHFFLTSEPKEKSQFDKSHIYIEFKAPK